MKEGDFYAGFDEARQKEYEDESRDRYGDELVNESLRRWKIYSAERKAEIVARGKEILSAMHANMWRGFDRPQIQTQVEALHKHIDNFYECSYQRFRGLGRLYREHPDFVAMYQGYDPGMPEFIWQAIGYYCDSRMSAE